MSLVPAGSFLSAGLGGYLWGAKPCLGTCSSTGGGVGFFSLQPGARQVEWMKGGGLIARMGREMGVRGLGEPDGTVICNFSQGSFIEHLLCT